MQNPRERPAVNEAWQNLYRLSVLTQIQPWCDHTRSHAAEQGDDGIHRHLGIMICERDFAVLANDFRRITSAELGK
jgi:hypothetical protein